jgi:hypothetical protein
MGELLPTDVALRILSRLKFPLFTCLAFSYKVIYDFAIYRKVVKTQLRSASRDNSLAQSKRRGR